jgi:4-hydroxybenzoate polyprenyltransferase
VAITNSLTPGVIFMAASLWTYIAGFDILYACQDIEFDREQGLFSLPAHLGPKRAMMVSSVLHFMTMGFFLAMFFAFGMHPIFLVFLAGIGTALVIEHRLVNPEDLSRIDLAFFHMNSIISVALLAGVLAEVALR